MQCRYYSNFEKDKNMQQIRMISLIFCFLLGCGTSTRNPATSISKNRGEYRALLHNVKAFPNDAEFRVKLAEWHLAENQFQKAIAHYDTALMIQSDYLPAKHGRALAQYQSGQKVQGMREFLAVLAQPESEAFVEAIAHEIGIPYTIRQITTGQGDDIHARYSNSGNEIVFQSDRDGNWELYRLALNRSEPIRLTFEDGDDESPVFSPDGRHILFTSTRDSGPQQGDRKTRNIFQINAEDGTNLSKLIASNSDDWFPVYSPKGDWMVFASDRSDERQVEFGMRQSDLFIFDFEETNVSQFTFGFGDKSSPGVSAKGDKVVYVNNVNGHFEIYEQNRNESYGRRLVWGGGSKGGPVYAPDNKKIVYFEKKDDNFDLYMYNRELQESFRLTIDPGADFMPVFSPRGDKILFSSNRNGSFDLFEMDLNSSPSRLELENRLSKIVFSLENQSQ